MDGFSDQNWRRELPAKTGTIQTLLLESRFALPEDYLRFLKLSNGGEGELGVEPGWFVLWLAETVIENNDGYEVHKWIPGFFGFGSNGGGELLAFDTRTAQPWKIYMIPFIPMEETEAILVAESFADFIKVIGQVMPN